MSITKLSNDQKSSLIYDLICPECGNKIGFCTNEYDLNDLSFKYKRRCNICKKSFVISFKFTNKNDFNNYLETGFNEVIKLM